MALATQCPHCNTTFRVAADQLKLRGGIVRCGACREVFDGNASLIDLDAIPAAAASEPEAPVSEPSASAAFDAEVAQIDARQTEDQPPIYTLDFDTTFDPFGILPKEPEPVPEPDAAKFSAPVVPAQAGTHSTHDGWLSMGETHAFPLRGNDGGELSDGGELNDGGKLNDGGELSDGGERNDGGEVNSTALQSEPELVAEPEPESEPEPEPAAEEDRTSTDQAELPVDEEIEAAPPPYDGDGDEKEDQPDDLEARIKGPDTLAAESTALLLTRQSAPGQDDLPHAPEPLRIARPAAAAEPPEPESDEPEFVRRSRLQEESGRTRRMLMGIGSLLLAVLLLLQGMTTFRNILAAQFPQFRPTLAATCALIGCRIDLPAQIDALSIETGELQTVAGNTFLLTTLLRNQSSLTQAWPNVELALTDTDDKTLVRRVFTPAEYLPKGVAPAKGFGARSEQPVKLYFELNQIKASGYHIAVFYP